MDVKALEYMIGIAEEENITKAAEKLFVTPSALNQQLLKLEKELGVQLFLRSKNKMVLTECGKIYVQNARRMVKIRNETLQMIDDITGNRKGSLSVGLTMDRGMMMFLKVYPVFYQEFPGIKVNPRELGARDQVRLLNEGKIDLGFVTPGMMNCDGLECIPIMEEDFLIALPKTHPLARFANPPGKPYAELDLSLLREEQFVMMPKESTFRECADSMCLKQGFLPQAMMETASNRTVVSMVACGLCCAITSEIYAYNQEDVAYFRIPDAPKWKLAAAYRKDAFISRPIRELIRMAKAYWKGTDEFAQN